MPHRAFPTLLQHIVFMTKSTFISFIGLAVGGAPARAVPSVCYACVCFLCIDFLSSSVWSELEPEEVGSYSPAQRASRGECDDRGRKVTALILKLSERHATYLLSWYSNGTLRTRQALDQNKASIRLSVKRLGEG